MKLTEELTELSSALMQNLTKSKNNLENIIKEAGDVKFRLALVLKQLNIEKEVHQRMIFKVKGALKNIKEKKYLNRV